MIAGFKPFDEMTADDYAAIGFRCGLEVHQQLLTRRKLFCRCPVVRYSDQYDAAILRHMRPTLSELGEYDGTALMEKKTRKHIHYRIHRDTVCTYEFDDTPPFMIDDRAVDIAIELCMLFRLNLVGELHIARKQYLDGSIPTGFQRTGILGVTGWMPLGDKKIGIRQLSLEEDSCREVSDIGHDRVYLTDRLGIPLVEVVTEPHMLTPQEAADACQMIRMVYRSTGKVRRGYGATRQDVNVSVRGGTRIEIKGVPQIGRIPRLVYNEAMRQWALLAIRDELKQRGITPVTFAHTSLDVTKLVARVAYQPVRAAIDKGLRVKCVVLKGFAGLLNRQTQEDTTFATEFSDRVRVIACLTELPNIVHSDTAAASLAAGDWQRLRKRASADSNDELVLVWGDERDTRTACEEIVIRAREATEGIPSDTRQALRNGTNGFERVLPGAERMYPDTDLPPIELTRARVERIQAGLPIDVWVREAKYRALGIPDEVIEPLCIARHVHVFDHVVDELGVDPTFASIVLVQRLKSMRRAGLDVGRLNESVLVAVFGALAGKRISRAGVFMVIEHLLQSELPEPPAELTEEHVGLSLKALKLEPVSSEAVDACIRSAIEKLDDADFATVEKKLRFAVGKVMRTLVGRVDGKHVAERVASTAMSVK